MNNSEAISLIMARFGGRTSTALRSKVLLELNQSIRELERGALKPWFMEELASGTLTANDPSLTLPTDFVQEIEDRAFKIRNSNITPNKWTTPVKVTMEELEAETEDTDPALPEGYALFGEKIYLGPTPDQAYSYKLPYYKRTIEIVDNTTTVTNPWLLEFFNYTTLKAATMVAKNHIQSDELANRLSSELQVAFDSFWREVEARQHTRRNYLLTNSEE